MTRCYRWINLYLEEEESFDYWHCPQSDGFWNAPLIWFTPKNS